MISESQVQYLDEVLGVSARAFRASTNIPKVSTCAEIVVLTKPTDSVSQELLAKILGSIKLKNFLHTQTESPQSLPEGQAARHILSFHSSGPCAREMRGTVTWWVLPDLTILVGTSLDVTARKKESWLLLQQLQRELKT